MKFPRSARIFRGHLDIAPFASVFFLLMIFVLLGALIYTPGVQVELPVTEDPTGTNGLTGTDQPTLAVAVDAAGRFYFENQPIEEDALKTSLQRAAGKSSTPLTLLVQADKRVTYEDLLRLTLLARTAGITNSWFAVLPHAFPATAAPPARKP